MRTLGLLMAAAVAVAGLNCAREQPESTEPGVIDVVARGLTFTAPDSIAGGWVTFRFRNESPVTHFAVLERMPEGVGLAEQQREVAPPFQAGMDALAAGDLEVAQASFAKLPAWFSEVVFMGGPGLTAPGRTSETTLYLEPGIYLLECYVKTGGTFHSFNRDTAAAGMVHQLTVTQPASAATEPEATLTVTLSSERGLETSGRPAAGWHTIAVRFEDQAAYPNFVGHDVHLARLADGADAGAVAGWMDWRQRAGLDTPSPVEFLGGVNEMPAGSTAYLTVELTPGRYAWVAEIPDPDAKGFLQIFSVP